MKLTSHMKSEVCIEPPKKQWTSNIASQPYSELTIKTSHQDSEGLPAHKE